MSARTEPEPKAKARKFQFKLPHVFIFMLMIVLTVSLLTYVIPGGQFVPDENGAISPGSFVFNETKSPVNPVRALLLILPSSVNNAAVIFMMLMAGGCIGGMIGMGFMDNVLDYIIFKLKDKGLYILVPGIFVALAVIGGLGGGGDLAIAYVPLGILFAGKLGLDPICAFAMSMMAAFIGFAYAPTATVSRAQYVSGVPLFSGFGFRTLEMGLMLIICVVYVLLYARRVQKNPRKSYVYGEWTPEVRTGETGIKEMGVKEVEIKEVKLPGRSLFCTFLFFAQFAAIIYFQQTKGFSMEVLPAVQIPLLILIGKIMGFSLDEIGGRFGAAVSAMSLLAVVVGLASTMSGVMNEAGIMPTIIYFFCLPLARVPESIAAVAMTAIVTITNVFIPSASSKLYVMMPILNPMAELLNLNGQIACQAFMLGDGITNICTPFLGSLVAGLAMCRISFGKWLKFVFPLVVILLIVSWIIMGGLAAAGWTGL